MELFPGRMKFLKFQSVSFRKLKKERESLKFFRSFSKKDDLKMKFKITLEAPGFISQVITSNDGMDVISIVFMIITWLGMFDDEIKNYNLVKK